MFKKCTNMPGKTKKTVRLSKRYRLPLSRVESALGITPRAADIEKAYDRFINDPLRLDHLKELVRWVNRELRKKNTSERCRQIYEMSPKDFPIILRVTAAWDKSVRSDLRQKKGGAKEAVVVVRNSRPDTPEYIRAVSWLKFAVTRDLQKALRTRNKELLFVLMDIARGEERQQAEDLLVKLCRTEPELRRLVNQLASKKNQTTVIRRLEKFNK